MLYPYSGDVIPMLESDVKTMYRKDFGTYALLTTLLYMMKTHKAGFKGYPIKLKIPERTAVRFEVMVLHHMF